MQRTSSGAIPGSHPPDQAPSGLGASRFDPERIDGVIAQLCDLDRDLLLGRCEGWGSWMFASGGFMVSLGLGTKRDGNIRFDTPLAEATIARLNTIAMEAATAGETEGLDPKDDSAARRDRPNALPTQPGVK